LLDVNWTVLSGILNRELHDDAPLAESTYRKAYQAARAYYDEVFLPMTAVSGGSAVADDIRAQKLELELERVKMRDERNEIARIQREMARRESIVELVKEGMHEVVTPLPCYDRVEVAASDNDLIVHITDIHAGIEIDNFCNDYSVTTLYDRLRQYLRKIDEVRQRHGSENCYVVLGGDCISGLIHINLRLENNLDVIKQVKVVSTVIACFVKELARMFRMVHVYSVPGNHGRLQPKKEDNLRGENLDALVPFIVNLMLADHENVDVHEDNMEPTVAAFRVRGNLVYGVHGDKDSMETVVQKLTMMFGNKPDIVLMGHRHTNGMSTAYDSKVVQSGSISGPDEYCMDHRLRNKPEQMLLVVTADGLDCVYDVKFE